MTRYFYGSILFALIITAISKNEMADICHDPNADTSKSWYYTYVVGVTQLLAFVLIALYSCVYAFRRL